MTENESNRKFGYAGPKHNYLRRMIRDVLKEHLKRRLWRLIDNSCVKVVLALFEEPHRCAKEGVYTAVFEIRKQVGVKSFFSGRADELLDVKMYELFKSQNFTQRLVREPI